MIITMKLGPLPVTLRQLQYIVAIAETRNFRHAASICLVSQPALSAQVAEAESALGVKLFERNQRGTLLTVAGTQIVERARRILIETDDLVATARRSVDPLRGPLRVGVIPTIAPYLLADLDPALRAAFPDLELFWIEDKTAELIRQVNDGELDAALLALETDIEELEYETIGRDPFVLVTSPTHALAKGKRSANLADLNCHDVLLLEDGHCFRDQALDLCSKAGANELGFRATSLATLSQMVAGGRGITLLPSLAIEVETNRPELVVRKFAKPAPFRTIVLAWRRQSAIAPALGELAAVAQRAFKKRH
jgi:LysR family hydrogen peroxide-inducible transcriptional activator